MSPYPTIYLLTMSTPKISKKILDRRKRQQTRYERIRQTDKYKAERRRMSKERYWKNPLKRLIKAIRKQGKVDGDIKAFDFWKLAKRQKLTCPLTGRRLSSQNVSVDHIVPLSKGGTNRIDNFRLVDKHANFARLNYTDEQFFELCRDVTNFQIASRSPPSAN